MLRIILLCLVLVGCGQKGPLYLPDPVTPVEPEPATMEEERDERLPPA